MMMRVSASVPWLLCLLWGQRVYAASTEHHANALKDWIVEKGGSFSPKIEMRRVDDQDPSSRFGMFALEDIEKDLVIFEVPRSCLITPIGGGFQIGDKVEANFGGEGEYYAGTIIAFSDDKTYSVLYDDGDSENNVKSEHIQDLSDGGMYCGTVKSMVKEMKLGIESEYGPFVEYLLEQPRGQIPSAWSPEGKNLLVKMLGKFLPPKGPVQWSLEKSCDLKSDDFSEHAAMLHVQRNWDELMIPIYDMMNHRNGKWRNTDCHSVHSDKPITVFASRDIDAGEEIYGSYNLCQDCGGRQYTYGTPEILRDYGFVEDLPQRWIIPEQRVAFELDMDDTDMLKVTWLQDAPEEEAVEFLRREIGRLTTTVMRDFQMNARRVPASEFETLKQFHQAYIRAIGEALRAVEEEEEECTEGECRFVQKRFDPLDVRVDPFDGLTPVCDHGRMFQLVGYTELEFAASKYQEMYISWDTSNRDVCFSLDSIVQMCGSYRPHYHEMVVHYTARFLPTIKRVIFVGGGDSMLLHEIIKYPSLEVVVGLELDQVVTRKSFKHFGTQPHWDNPKVQWWYGDATKSLLMLPQDYFGSFDMVLVDLSETVMSMTVTDELDMMEAFALLLKPEGIFVKNELYLEKLSAIFDYTIQIHYYDVPVICSQALIMASNKVDFLDRLATDHSLENLYYEPNLKFEERFDIVHDYRHNSTVVKKHCRDADDPIKGPPEEQTRSPGILMIVEAEQASDLEGLQDLLSKALVKIGIVVKKTVVADNVVVLLWKDGYVVARGFPDYCALDIHLFGSFLKHEEIRQTLVQALGSKSMSSYRIVAGGMFGVEGWKDDDTNRGPRITQICPSEDDSRKTKGRDTKSVTEAVLKQVLDLSTVKKDFLVFCGSEGEECQMSDLLSGAQVVRPCDGLQDASMFSSRETFQDVVSCEGKIVKQLRSAGKKFDFIAFDPSTPVALAKIFHHVIQDKGNKRVLMSPDVIMLTLMMTEGKEVWPRTLLERSHRDIIVKEPAFRAEVMVEDGSIEVGILSAGDDSFIFNLVEMTSKLESQDSINAEVKNIVGGDWHHQGMDFKPSQFFLPEDYDQKQPLEQWKSQQPFGLQTVTQLEVSIASTGSLEKGDSVTANYGGEGEFFPGHVVKVNADGKTFHIVYEDGDEEPHVPRNMILKTNGNPSASDMLSTSQIEDAVRHALTSIPQMKNANIETIDDVLGGDGCIVVVLWSGGQLVVLWDGRYHVDMNLFSYKEDLELADQLSNLVMIQLSSLVSVLRDEQPRGTGRVVNFLHDLDGFEPHWADKS